MMITSLAAPPPGSTAAGDLYVDLQSKTMWMGVDVAVDPVGAVLISDIMAIQPSLDDTLNAANAYTDSKFAQAAPLHHTHPSSDVTDFSAAVLAVIAANPVAGGSIPPRLIAQYAGSLSDIGVGVWAGWALCDGSNGTPDLRDKFVLGAGNRAAGVVNTLSFATTDVIPAHKHTVLGHVITMAEMPQHNHGVTASGSGSGSGSTDAQGTHTHAIQGSSNDNGDPGGAALTSGGGVWGNFSDQAAGNHAHNVSVNVNVNVSGATDSRGSNTAHNHEMDLANAHSHQLSQSQLREAIPYFTLAFVQKLP